MPDLLRLVAIDDLHEKIGGLGEELARAVEDAETQCAGVGPWFTLNGPRLP